MVTLTDLQATLERVDQSIIRLLRERAQITRDAEVTSEDEAEILAQWLELTEEANLDDRLSEKLGRLIIAISRRTQE